MRTTIIALLLVFIGSTTYAGQGQETINANQQGKLTIEVDGLTSDEGNLRVLLFSNEKGFPNEEWHALYQLNVDIENAQAQILFENIPHNTYAIYVYHDVNSNEQFDKNWAGAAKESFGYSNINSSRVSPLFSQSAFEFTSDNQEIQITVVKSQKGKTKGSEVTSMP